jgi:uncharacterized protein YecE (DUF72 family)
MEYGHTTDIAGIDFTLPDDHPSNAAFLSTLRGEGDFRIYTGCAKWGIKEWVGTLYPDGTKSDDYLTEYGQRFNSVELNTTGYRFGSAKRMGEWADQTPAGFTFSPKFPQIITQFKLLGDVQEQTERFVESISGFGDKLGMPFLLLPERFKPERIDKVAAFFEKIPKGFPVAFELRHPEFYSAQENIAKLAEILRAHRAPWIITDSAGERGVIHQVLTSDTVFIRFSGCDNADVDKERMNGWVDRISAWRNAGVRTVYWYAHNIPEVKTPIYAAYFNQQANQKLGIKLLVPKVAVQ